MKTPPLFQILILLSTFPIFYIYSYTMNMQYYEPEMVTEEKSKKYNSSLEYSNSNLKRNNSQTHYGKSNIVYSNSNTKYINSNREQNLNFERANSNKINNSEEISRDRDIGSMINLVTASKTSKVDFSNVNLSGLNQDDRKLVNFAAKSLDKTFKTISPNEAEIEQLNRKKIESKSNYSDLHLDYKRRHWHTWTKQLMCKNYVVRFTKPNSRYICALASYPGSGNTWFRYLIEVSSGTFTSSIYDDAQLYLWGYLGEIESVTAGTTLIQKVHTASLATVQEFNRTAILIIRNPYRAIISYHNFLFGGHKAYASVINYRRKDWPAFVHMQLRSWLELIMIWIKEGRRVLVIHYENLQEDPMREIRRALDFLEVPMDEERLNCVRGDLGKSLKRDKEVFPSNLEIFSNKTRDKIDRGVRYVSYLLQKHGHQAPPLHLYEFYNGSSSNRIDLIPCQQNETNIECDDRVDELNMETRVLSFHNIEKESTTYTETSINDPQEISTDKYDDENLIPKKHEKKIREPFKFEKSTMHKIETSLLMFGTKLLAYVTESPVKKLLAEQFNNTALNFPSE